MSEASPPAAQPQVVIRDDCPLCAGRDARVLAAFAELTWVKCGCGLIYKRSHVDRLTQDPIYGESYFTRGVYETRTRRRIAKSRRQILDALNVTTPGPLLDIGCSLGYTLRAAQQLGLDAAGVDVSDFAVVTCRKQGFVAERAVMDGLPFDDGRFAIVTMKHVLEHTPQPRAALREVRRVLRSGGALFVAIPDARYAKSVRDPRRSRFYAPVRGASDHFIYYTPETLSRLLAQEGFSVARINPALIHREASFVLRVAQGLVAPLRAVGQRILDSAGLRKEFWLTAVRAE